MWESIYLVAVISFGLILIASWLFSELFEALGEGIEAAGNAVEGFLEAIPGVGDVELTGDIQWGNPGMVRSLLVFGTLFGGGGYLALTRLHFSEGKSFLVGLVSGGFGFLVSFLSIRFLMKQEGTVIVSTSGYVGLKGVVLVSLGPNSRGSIQVQGSMGYQSLSAKASEPIPQGTTVEIISMEGGVAEVKKVG